MIKYGEVTSLNGEKATVRIYKVKNNEAEPTSLTVNATTQIDCKPGDFVKLDMNVVLFYLTTALGYLLPFIVSLVAVNITVIFTDNIIITQIVFLSALAVTYFVTSMLADLPLFKHMHICHITSIEE